MKITVLLALLIAPAVCFSQNAYEYYGDKVQLEAHYFQSRNIGKLQGDKKQAYQGMDIYNGYVASAQKTGIVTFYDMNNNEFDKEKQLKLSTASKTASAYNISFSNKKWANEDVLPLLYVSGNNGVLNVERVEKKFKSLKPVQSISLYDVKCERTDWAIDRENNYLYAFCSTNGKHQVLRFNIPEVGESSTDVKLSSADAIDNYYIENSFQGKPLTATHGIFIHNGQMFITSGNGTAKDSSRLYVWDLYGKMMRNIIDLSAATRDELEACSVYDGALYVQSQGNFYKLIF